MAASTRKGEATEGAGCEVENLAYRWWQEGRQAGIKEVVEWLSRYELLLAYQPPKEGEKYTYLGDYILKYGHGPTMGFSSLSDWSIWQDKLKEWGIKEEE